MLNINLKRQKLVYLYKMRAIMRVIINTQDKMLKEKNILFFIFTQLF